MENGRTAVTGLTRVSARKTVQHYVITKTTSLSKGNVHTKQDAAKQWRNNSNKPQCQRGLCLPAKIGLNIRTIIAKILSATTPEVIAEVEAVCAAEVADLSVLDGETVLALVSKETEMKVKMIQSCLLEIQN